jgi:hypothetical protein
MITIFKNIRDKSNPFYRDIEAIFERIKSGKSKGIVEKVRTAINDDVKAEYKRQLPSICFSGKFKIRSAQGCLQHSGYICLDFDKYASSEQMAADRDMLCNDKYTYALFTSPSGNGLKVIVQIPAIISDHKAHFKALEEYYSNDNFDSATSDVSRVCFESYDPDLYINKDAEIFTEKVEDEVYDYSTRAAVIPVESSNLIIQNLQKWFDRKYGMGKGNRNQNLFIFANGLNEFGIEYHEALSHLMQYTEKDFSKSEIETTVKSAYKNKSKHKTKYFENRVAREEIVEAIKSGKDSKRIEKEFSGKFTKEQIEEVVKEQEATATVLEFWYINDKGRLTISSYKYKLFLEQMGYAKYYPENSEHYLFVKIESNFIEHTTNDRIKDFVLNYLLEKNEISVYELMARDKQVFTENYLSQLNTIEIPFVEDGKDFAMLYYKNCVVKVMPDKIETIDYLSLDGMLWRHHVIDRDYKKCKSTGSLFDLFLTKVSETPERKEALMGAMGYLMHSYKTRSNNKAIILNDQQISENPNGGSGKGIVFDAISRIKKTYKIDGKLFSFEKSFIFQSVNIETQVLVFDDVQKNFKFENLFSLITEGITLEKKNRDAIRLNVERSPKIGITTNYTIGGSGGSFERRKYEVELSGYFSEKHTPEDEFGKMLFDDFNSLEWCQFDNLMIDCIQEFLTSGFRKVVYQNMNDKKLIKDTSYEFWEWAIEAIEYNRKYQRVELFVEFIGQYPDWSEKGKYKLSHKAFNKWIDSFSMYANVEIKNYRDGKIRQIEFHKPDAPTPVVKDYHDTQKDFNFDDTDNYPPENKELPSEPPY